MNTDAVIEQTRQRNFALVEPLDWFQLRALLWEACEADSSAATDRWEQVASQVNSRCAQSRAHSAATYQEVCERLASEIPEASDIFDVPGAGQRLWTRLLYETAQNRFKYKPIFMNLGFVELEPAAETLALNETDEMLRPFIQLYQHVLKPVSLEGKEVLEVGCGAGGGASFMMRYHHPQSVVGIDLVQANIDAANTQEPLPGMTFKLGDAASLPFPDNSFDVVVNIESSHCYPSVQRFLEEVKRVLRPNGFFLFADHRPVEDEWGQQRTVDSLRQLLRETGMKILRDEDITPNINAATELLHEGKQFMLAASEIEGFDLIHFNEIMHCRGSQNYEKLKSGEWQYRCYALQKSPV
jgi:ubiquinone/menaquinone biosynthesis C-methylase UbiE